MKKSKMLFITLNEYIIVVTQRKKYHTENNINKNRTQHVQKTGL